MNTDAQIIKEFLVSVGLKIDESTLAKFDGLIGTIGKNAFRVASVLVTAAGAIETFVTAVADKMDDLYWATQRLGSSADRIQDYALGIENLGGTAEGARSSLEGLARSIRLNPGFGGLLTSLGVHFNHNNPDTVNIVGQLATNLKKRYPYFVAAKYAEMLGIDEGTFWAAWHAGAGGVTGAGGDTYRSMYGAAGVDPNKATKALHDYMVQVRELGAEYKALATILAYRLLPVAERILAWTKQTTQWLIQETNSKHWEGWGDKLGKAAGNAWNLAKALGGVSKAVYGVVDALSHVFTGKSFFDSMSQAMSDMTKIAVPAIVTLKAWAAAIRGDWAEESRLEKEGMHDWKQILGLGTYDPKFWGDGGGGGGRGAGAPAGGGGRPDNSVERASKSFLRRTLEGMGYGIGSDYRTQAETDAIYHDGRHHRSAHGIPGAAFDITPTGGMLGANADRIIAALKAAGYWILFEKGIHPTIRAMADHIHASLAGDPGGYRSVPGYGSVYRGILAQARGGTTVIIHQKNEIHVASGGGYATTVSKDIGRQLDRVNGDLVRNLKPAVQ